MLTHIRCSKLIDGYLMGTPEIALLLQQLVQVVDGHARDQVKQVPCAERLAVHVQRRALSWRRTFEAFCLK